MARPELPVGTWGKICRKQMAPGRSRARARFRDYDGVTREVAHLYRKLRDGEAPRLPELPVQYSDFAVWQRHQDFSQEVAFWRTILADAPPAVSIPNRSRPGAPSPQRRGEKEQWDHVRVLNVAPRARASNPRRGPVRRPAWALLPVTGGPRARARGRSGPISREKGGRHALGHRATFALVAACGNQEERNHGGADCSAVHLSVYRYAAMWRASAPRGTTTVSCARLAILSLNARMPALPTFGSGFGSTGKPTSGPGGSSAGRGLSGPAAALGFGFNAGAGDPGGDPASFVPFGIGAEAARGLTAISGGR